MFRCAECKQFFEHPAEGHAHEFSGQGECIFCGREKPLYADEAEAEVCEHVRCPHCGAADFAALDESYGWGV